MKTLIILTFGVALAALAAPPSPDYELMFEDNFDGPRVNEALWRYREGPRTSGTWINGLNRKENVFLQNGNLVIRAKVEKINGKTENTGGGLISRANFGYGYYETRSKPFMAGQGVHSAFWQAGGNRDDQWDPNNAIFEIDSYEIDSGHWVAANNLYVHLAPKGMSELPWPYRNGKVFQLDREGWWMDAYEYTPEGVTFYDRGQVVGRAEFTDLAAQQMVWLTALNGVGKVEAAKQPADTLFDYFRYYARDFPGHNLLPNGDFEYNHDKTPARPIAWRQDGTEGACSVVRGGAARDAYYLKIGGQKDFKVRLGQTLQYIRNGSYQLSARVKTPGGKVNASLQVNGRTLDIPAAAEWTRIALDGVAVSNQMARIELHATGDAANALCIDDIQFKKPVPPGQPEPAQRPFTLVRDPIWQIAMTQPIEFNGDASFFFISRNVGYGDAMTLMVDLTPKVLASTCPITRAPAKGRNGWALLLGSQGEIAFRIGSKADFTELVARNAYSPGKTVKVKCFYSKGTAAVFINGRKAVEKTGLKQGVRDSTQAGTFGATASGFEPVGEVMGESAQKPAGKNRNYIGSIFDLRVYNRAVD